MIGIVIIGRNEGERLIRCLSSLVDYPRVYVDSGSSDASVSAARSMGVSVVELNLEVPFTAARARNEGFQHLLNQFPNLDFVMFVDGDCEVVDGWVESALTFLANNDNVVAVCGRRKERFPEYSIYNAMCDIEWDTPIGEAKSCGGDAVFRASALVSVGGFNPAFIAGEEPELCYRLRELGGKIHRLDKLMTMHDAAMNRFSQWWRRAERSGYAYYLGYREHGKKSVEKFKRKEVLSICVWGGGAVVSLVVSVFQPQILLILLAAYLLQSCRVYLSIKDAIGSKRLASIYACFTMLGKVPQFLGLVKAYWKLRRGLQMTLVEYK